MTNLSRNTEPKSESIPVSPDDTLKIKEPEMIINLEYYLNKIVEVELHNGDVITGNKITVDRSISSNYKYVLGSYLNFYSQDGTNETHRDYNIIKIKEVKEPEMTINLEDYIGKTVEVELRNGGTITGHKIRVDRPNSFYNYVISSYLYYFNQDGMSDTSGNYDIIKIKEIKEPEMTTNLEEFVGKTVEIKHRDGHTRVGKLGKMKINNHADFSFPYHLNPIPHGGSFNYNEYGRCFSDNISPYDAVEVKEVKTVIRSKIDVFTTENERVELTVDDDGLFLTACGKGARKDLSIGSRDLVISVARCILEHYGVVK